MGRKRARKGKHLFLYLTCVGLFPFFIFGCVHLPKKFQGRQLLRESMAQMVNRQYESSMTSCLTVLNDFPGSLTDQAHFQIGLLYANPGYLKQDYKKSMASLDKVLNATSKGNLRDQAQLWSDFLKDVMDKEQKSRLLSRKTISLKKAVEKRSAETKKHMDLIVSLEETVASQAKQINLLQDQISELKRVDLRIEEKKQARK